MTFIDIFQQFKSYLKKILDPSAERENETETVENICKGIDFKGSNLWVLIFAIFIASLGLNVNSPAVIIGAMLISPLMGPIMGIGLGIGISDFELIKKAFRNLAIATVFGILTSTLYFLLSPLNEARSELLARTTPTIYDVLIAFFGGMAGIVASSTRLKGNVIPGVAIATALMPPLCTAGYGLACGNLSYFIGAFYLYMINSVFIAFATTLGVKLMHFSKKTFVDKQREKKVQQIVYTILLLTMVPSIYITYKMIKVNIYETNAARFIAEEMKYPNSFIVSKHILQDSISVTLIGKEIPEDYIAVLYQKMKQYGLEDTRLNIIQGLGKEREDGKKDELNNLVLQDFYKRNQEKMQIQAEQISRLQAKLNTLTSYDSLSMQLIPEIKILFPEIQTIGISRLFRNSVTAGQTDTLTIALVTYQQTPSSASVSRFKEWLSTRIGTHKLEIISK